jgi:tetratricopeptide (TPR) repeat protein
MRTVVLVALLAGTAVADKPVRKTEPKVSDKFLKAASEAFARARVADEAGNLEEALKHYEKAHAISPHANTMYNIADLQRRLGRTGPAVWSYRKYLELAPQADDRPAVEALIRTLETAPGTLEVIVEDEATYRVFVDGKPLTRATIELPRGDHVVDVITPISATSTRCEVDAGAKRTCKISLPARVDGNTFLSGPHWLYRSANSINGFRYEIKERFQMKPGKQSFKLSAYGDQQCAPLEFTVAAGDVVTYVWIDAPERRTFGKDECAKVTGTARVLKF